MSDIKIFVSHRIDIDSELIGNPLYVPVRCGAVFDRENPMNIAGDGAGDNISERRMSFCEFTVQYWVWKNARADYYGLCHYRRFLSFAEETFRTDEYNMVYTPVLTRRSKRRYGLLDEKTMRREIEGYDAVVSEYAPVKNIPTPQGRQSTVRELWGAHVGVFFDGQAVDMMFQLIDSMAPEYSESARAYFAGKLHRGFNCYVMKRELFDRLCRFQFPIMFEVERRLDTTGYTQTMLRTPAFIGEMLYGIFMYHITTCEQWRVKERQLVFFRDTERIKSPWDEAWRYMQGCADRAVRAVVDPVMPKGSRGREICKKIYYKATRAEVRGVANIK